MITAEMVGKDVDLAAAVLNTIATVAGTASGQPAAAAAAVALVDGIRALVDAYVAHHGGAPVTAGEIRAKALALHDQVAAARAEADAALAAKFSGR